MTNEMIEKVRKVLEEKYYIKNDRQNNGTYSIEIYTDYDDQLSDNTVKEMLNSENPMEHLEDLLSYWAWDYKYDYALPELKKTIYAELGEDGLDDLDDWLEENVFYYYDTNDFDRNIHAYIMVDTGDKNYDFSCHNCMNTWDGSYELDKISSLYWLAKQQRKADKLNSELKKIRKLDNNGGHHVVTDDKFVRSCIEELNNQTSCMSALTFLLDIPLFDYLKIKQMIEAEKEYNKSYYADERTGTGYIVLDKSVESGLFNTWSGGGSMFGIELEKDVKLPIKYIFDICMDGIREYGYDPNEVYGFYEGVWRNAVKEMHPMKEAVTICAD